VLGLDRARLAAIAADIGPRIAELDAGAAPVDPALIAHFDLRGGYLKAAEGGAKLPAVMELIEDDVAKVRAGAR
jgi:hypothetical protein